MALLPKLINHRGQSLIEIIVAIGITAILLPALATGLVASRQGKPQQIQRSEATSLLQEAGEAVRVARETGWTAFAVNETYHPVVSGNTWTLALGSETTNGYTRSIVISDVFRDGTGKIVTSGGTHDPSTKEIMATVSWLTPLPSEVSSVSYVTRYLDNLLFTQSTTADFTAGTLAGTAVSTTAGGEIVLGAGGQGNWCEPNLSLGQMDLPKNGVANALTAIPGQAFAGTGENASGVSFADVRVTDTNPPGASVTKTFDGYKTNGVFGETGYAYLATDNNSKEIVILDISGPTITEVGYFDASGPASAQDVFVLGNIGYMTQGSRLKNFDLSGKSGPRSPLDSDGVSLAGTGTAVVVIGNYAYVSIAGSATELQIIDVSDSTNLQIVGQADINGQAAQDVFVNPTGTRAYLATNASPTQREFFIVDTSAKTGNRPTLGSYEANGLDAKAVTIVTGNKAILVGSGGEEYQVINITDEANPVRCGGLNIDSGVNDIASVIEGDGDAYSYIITGDSGNEFKIIEGGPGGKYASSGTFESTTFDPGFQTAFNRLVANVSQPISTGISLQVAVAPAVAGNCAGATFTYLGPDASSSTFFTPTGATISASVPFGSYPINYTNPGRCFRYKAFLTTSDPTTSPILYDVSVNYSP